MNELVLCAWPSGSTCRTSRDDGTRSAVGVSVERVALRHAVTGDVAAPGDRVGDTPKPEFERLHARRVRGGWPTG